MRAIVNDLGPVLLLYTGGNEVREIPAIDGLVIGSGGDADLIVPGVGTDPLVCRLDGDGESLSLEVSTKGARGKNRKVSATTLRSGVGMAIGRSRVVFLAPGGMAAPRLQQAERPLASRVWIGVALVVPIVAAVLVLGRSSPPPAESRDPEGLFASVRGAVAEGRWEEARQRLAEAEEEIGPHRQWIRYRSAIERESEQAGILDRFRSCAKTGDSACAADSWRQIDKDSLSFLHSQSEIEEMASEMGIGLLGAGAGEGGGALATGIGGGEAEPGEGRGPRKVAAGDPARNSRAEPTVAKAGSGRAPDQPRGKKPRGSREEVSSLWSRGRMAEAMALARTLGPPLSDRLVGDLRRYEKALLEAESVGGTAAFPWLEQLVSIERDWGIRTERGAVLRRRLADLHTQAGRASEASEEWERALRHYTKGLDVLPDHGAAREGVKRIHQEAERIFLEGYAAREMAPALARQRWSRVLGLLPEGHPTRVKTIRRMEELEMRGALRERGHRVQAVGSPTVSGL